MEKPSYNFEVSNNGLIFSFESVSREKIIKKVVVYEPLVDELYHMGFGDLVEDNTIDYSVKSANKDMNKVLSTVVQTMFLFFEKYPDKKVVFTGSNEIRTRLYRSIISKFVEEIELYFLVEGFKNDGTQEVFRKNEDYYAFLIYPRI
ncbi:hypothetical protein [Emticicia sp. W12TSBA100-4]|uniref:DUF6934 family protein n=1 Tax=Emticicia sp. W12TSBA100-4 TaxID=3160965 RepID=UPI003305BF93